MKSSAAVGRSRTGRILRSAGRPIETHARPPTNACARINARTHARTRAHAHERAHALFRKRLGGRTVATERNEETISHARTRAQTDAYARPLFWRMRGHAIDGRKHERARAQTHEKRRGRGDIKTLYAGAQI